MKLVIVKRNTPDGVRWFLRKTTGQWRTLDRFEFKDDAIQMRKDLLKDLNKIKTVSKKSKK